MVDSTMTRTQILSFDDYARLQQSDAAVRQVVLLNANIYTGDTCLQEHAIVVDGDRIEAVIAEDSLESSAWARFPRVNLEGLNISPGWIDLQLNGCGGVLFNDDVSASTLDIMQQTNERFGCTAFLPTLITSSDQDMLKAIEVMRAYRAVKPDTAIGLHLEGPYISLEKRGIHDKDLVRGMDDAMLQAMCDNADVISKVTLAPERCSKGQIAHLKEAGITVSIGHTNATYEQAVDAIAEGATFATHLYNAMSPTTGREPGVIGAIFEDQNIYTGIILDGHHVHYANARLAKRLMGDRLCLVTDAVAPAGTDMEYFYFVGRKVYHKDGKCFGEDGTLGGAACTMDECVRNAVNHVGIDLDEALRMASLYPARAIGVDDRLGSIENGKLAQLTIFDEDLKVHGCLVNGIAKA